ncbi:hypothetical protein M0R45_020926 [Rubus argutus]|uniref:Uncharacterized protein n=1 Tax=Rubus argutus TaxID=59490 RepID=A0AAW1XDD7_RUBAR
MFSRRSGCWAVHVGKPLLPLLSSMSGCNPQSRDLILQSRDLKEIALAGSPGSKIMRQVAQKTLNLLPETPCDVAILDQVRKRKSCKFSQSHLDDDNVDDDRMAQKKKE